MRGLSGLWTLVVIALLFTISLSVSGSELLNETSDFGFLMENKINVQMEQVVPVSVEGVMSVFSDNLEPIEVVSFYNMIVTTDPYIGDEMEIITDLPYKNDLNYTHISELRRRTWHSAGRYKQISFV